MNSKYAPIVALTVVVILILAALGWFLAIKPRFAAAADLSSQSEEVDQNTAQIQTATATLTTYEENLAALPPLDESLALNLPSIPDVQTYRERVTAAVASSKVSLVTLSMDTSYVVDGWQMPPQNRTSSAVAQLFAKGPIHTTDSGSATAQTTTPNPTASPAAGGATDGYTPVVVATNEIGPVVDDMYGLPVTIEVVGSYSQTAAFLKTLTDPAEQLFLVYETEQEARPASSSSIPGVPDAKDGDVTTTITGAFYLLSPDTSVVDDDELAVVSVGGKSPFAPSAGAK